MKLEAWLLMMALVVLTVVSLDHMGFNGGSVISASLHSVEHALAQPL